MRYGNRTNVVGLVLEQAKKNNDIFHGNVIVIEIFT